MFPDKVFLTSKSPRRLELLRFCFQNVQQIHSLREEPKWHLGEGAQKYIERCIEVKSLGAEEAFQSVQKEPGWQLVVAADTIVVLDGVIFGKPESPADAVKMLSKMVGREHSVLTAFSAELFKNGNKKEIYRKTLDTKVRFRKASQSEIKAYVKTGEPLDKSGSYGVQGPALQFVEKVDGSYQSVMGIPLFEIQKTVKVWKDKYSSNGTTKSRENTF